MGFAAQATCWSAVDLYKAVMTNMCEALNRLIREMHPEVATDLATKTDLLLSGVAVDEHAKVTIESEASKVYEASPWAADKRAAEIVRPAPVQTADRVPPKSLARDVAFAMLQWRILSAAEQGCEATPRHAYHALCRRTWHWHVLDGHAQVTDRTGTECAMEDGHGVTTRCNARCGPALHVCPGEGQ